MTKTRYFTIILHDEHNKTDIKATLIVPFTNYDHVNTLIYIFKFPDNIMTM